jgi:hypothetical protein
MRFEADSLIAPAHSGKAIGYGRATRSGPTERTLQPCNLRQTD